MNSTEKGNIGEEFVNEIAYNSFLKYWCYPSPKDENGDKKEICDLLILFGDTVIIVSVKNYGFKENYSRYFRNTLDKAVKQIYGAERKLFSKHQDVYFKHPNKSLEKFNNERIEKVFRIIVNLGEGVKFYPFNCETKNEKFVTIFDKKSFETIIKELDTIPDFIEYLNKRELLFSDKIVTILPGEENDFPIETAAQFFEYTHNSFDTVERQSILLSGKEHDLLAHYLINDSSFPDLMKSKEYGMMFFQLDGKWEEYISRKEVLLKKQSDINSYFIDELVKREILSSSNPKSEELAKELLSFDRFHRRMISNNLLQFYNEYKDYRGMRIARRYGDFNGTGVVFVFYSTEMKDQLVNVLLDITIDSFCLYSNYKSNKMILIAITKDLHHFKMGLTKDIMPFSKDKEQQVREDIKDLGWFTNIEEIQVTEKEYPDEE